MSPLLVRVSRLKLVRRFIQDAVYRDLIGKSAIAFLSRNLGVMLGMVFSITVARMFGPAGLGSFSVMLALLLPLSVAVRLGLDNLQVRLVPQWNYTGKLQEKAQSYQTMVRIIAILSLGASCILILQQYLGNPLSALAPTVVLIAIAIVLPAHALYFLNIQTLKGEMRIDLAALFENIIVWTIALCFLFIWRMTTITQTLNSPIIVYTIGILAALPVSSYFVKRISLVPSGKTTNLASFLSQANILLRQSLPMWSTAMVSIALTSADVLMVAAFLPKADVGIYTAGVKLISFMSFPLAAVINIAGPRFAEAYAKHDIDLLYDNFMKATRLGVWGAMPILLFALLLPGPLLSIFGGSFTQGISVVYVLAFGQFVNIIVGPIGFFLLMTKKAVILQYIMWIALGVSLLLNYLLIPKIGINGAAIAGTAALVIRNVGCWIVVKRFFGFSALYLPGEELFKVRRQPFPKQLP